MHSVFICKQCTNIRNNNTQENDHRVCVNEDSLFSSPSGRVANLQTVGFARPLYKYLAFISFCVLASILTGALILFLKRHRRTCTRELQLGEGASCEKIELYESNETPSPLTNTRRPDSSVYEYDCCATENVPVAGRPNKGEAKAQHATGDGFKQDTTYEYVEPAPSSAPTTNAAALTSPPPAGAGSKLRAAPPVPPSLPMLICVKPSPADGRDGSMRVFPDGSFCVRMNARY